MNEVHVVDGARLRWWFDRWPILSLIVPGAAQLLYRDRTAYLWLAAIIPAWWSGWWSALHLASFLHAVVVRGVKRRYFRRHARELPPEAAELWR